MLLLFMMCSLWIIVNLFCYIVHWTRTSMYIGYWTLNKYYDYYYCLWSTCINLHTYALEKNSYEWLTYNWVARLENCSTLNIIYLFILFYSYTMVYTHIYIITLECIWYNNKTCNQNNMVNRDIEYRNIIT